MDWHDAWTHKGDHFMKHMIFVLLLLPMFAFADGKPRELPEHEHPHGHPGLQSQIDINAQRIIDNQFLISANRDGVRNNGLWIDELDRNLSTQITAVNQIATQNADTIKRNFNLLKSDVDDLTAAVAAESSLNFNESNTNGRYRVTLGTATYDGEVGFGLALTKKFAGQKAFGLGVATASGETLVKGQFAFDLGGSP